MKFDLAWADYEARLVAFGFKIKQQMYNIDISRLKH